MTEAELQTCRRVADYFRRTAMPFFTDIFASEKCAETEAKRNSADVPRIEFYLTFYSQVVRKFEVELVETIKEFALGNFTASELKTVCDRFIKAHTVVWVGGVPFWKAKEIE